MIWLFFALIQVVNLVLVPFGWIICLWPALAKFTWIFWNDDDGAVGSTWWGRYVWLAWRNPVDNLRRIRGVAGAGRPLIYHWWTSTPGDVKSGHYIKVGWESGTPYYPVFQPFGAGRGY